VFPPVTETSHAVFLSYASQDAPAAQKICEAFRAAGIEVFLDQSELRGGDAWDQKIRREIRDCALFIPVISANTASRHEGYFRLEWDLADQRTHMIARSRVFVVPVCLDATTEVAADVPESFKRVQWTRLPAGETPPAFVERVQRLLFPETLTANRHSSRAAFAGVPPIQERGRALRSKPVLLAIAALIVLVALGYVVIDRFQNAKHPAAAAAFDPPPHSIAVLPFVNMSADKEQEYFSDGLTEEILNSLALINGLQVAARTSSFSFQGEHADIVTVAHKLNVGAVLEGSVRRSGNTMRVTTQLINAVTGFHLWSHTYDRDLTDVLKLQTEIADAVAGALKVTLLGDVATKIELGGTRNTAAFDAYLRGQKIYIAAHSSEDKQAAITAYTEAIGLDPNYALALAGRSLAFNAYAGDVTGQAVRENLDKAQEDARKAVALAPDLAEAHLALAEYFEGVLDFPRANEAHERSIALAPGNARVLRDYATFAVAMGHTEAGIAAARRAVVLDPLSPAAHGFLGGALYLGRKNREALAAYQDALILDPEHPVIYAFRGLIYYALGDYERARASCESKPDYWQDQKCLAITYNKLGRRADAEGMFQRLRASIGDAAYESATIYAQWGNVTQALASLETALRQRDSDLEDLKVDPLLDPLRKEPRFQAIERELRFPD
jgi:TolB-like protein/Tfp pilus assembly protein PilF